MRIISQYGCYDIPYERTMLTNIGTKIYADNLAVKELCVAEYSTEEKAEKAMEMCRKNYADSEFNRSTLCGMGTKIEMLKDHVAEDYKDSVCDKFTFRFPADDEVE